MFPKIALASILSKHALYLRNLMSYAVGGEVAVQRNRSLIAAEKGRVLYPMGHDDPKQLKPRINRK